MNYAELVQAVYDETGRNDLVAETRSKILATVQFLHGREKYFKDILVAEINFSTPSFIQELDVSTLTQFRQLAFLRKKFDPALLSVDPSYPANMPGLYGWYPGCYLGEDYLRPIDPTDIFDDFYYKKLDVVWQAGTTLNMRSTTVLGKLKVGYYSWPNLDTSNDAINFSSWIADEYPWAVVFIATAAVMRTQGQTDSSLQYWNNSGNALGQIQMNLIDVNQIEVEGR